MNITTIKNVSMRTLELRCDLNLSGIIKIVTDCSKNSEK